MATMKQLYTDLRTKILSLQSNGKQLVNFCQVWNNQVDRLRNDPNDQYAFPFPAVFIEMGSPYPVAQLGNGAQEMTIVIRLHIVHEFYNNITTTDGIMEQDLQVFDLRDGIYSGMNKYEPDGAGALTRTGEMQDFDHDNLYHLTQEYACNFIDLGLLEPVGGQEATVDTLEVDLTISPTFLHQPD
jgi:hypothetical protein